MIPGSVRELIRRRAGDRCEYCRLRQEHSQYAHHVEHIFARQHLADDDLENLALACHYCNSKKGPNLAGIDPLTGEIVALFHPRRQEWKDHFRWTGQLIEGLSATGRATVIVLDLNNAKRLRLRSELLKDGRLH